MVNRVDTGAMCRLLSFNPGQSHSHPPMLTRLGAVDLSPKTNANATLGLSGCGSPTSPSVTALHRAKKRRKKRFTLYMPCDTTTDCTFINISVVLRGTWWYDDTRMARALRVLSEPGKPRSNIQVAPQPGDQEEEALHSLGCMLNVRLLKRLTDRVNLSATSTSRLRIVLRLLSS